MPSSDAKSGVDKARIDELRRQLVRNIPQKLLREMSGRQAKQIVEQAARYDLPFSGATFDLFDFFKAFFDFLAVNARKLKGPEPSLDGVPRDPGERKKLADARRAEHKLAVETSEVITRIESERQTMEAIAHHVSILNALAGRLAVKLANKPLAECRSILKKFAKDTLSQTYGRSEG